jgi:hypothetical protein
VAPQLINKSRKAAMTRNWIILGSLLLLAGTVVAWQLKPAQPKPLNSDTITLAKYMSSSDFQQLDEAHKRSYREVIRSKSKELAQALANGKITRAEYDEAYLNGWLARQMDHMGDYFRLPIADRKYVWADQYNKKKATKAPSTDPVPSDEVEKAFIQRVVSTWSADEQAQWDEFRRASRLAKGKK